MRVTKKIELDFARSTSPVVVFAKQGDKDSRIIEITPLENGVNLDIPEGVKARFSCKKPDGKKVYNDQVEIYDGKIIVTLSEQTLLAWGEAVAEVVLHAGEIDADGNILGGVLSSQNFILNIQPSALTEADMESSDEFQSYKAALVDVEEIAKNIPLYGQLDEAVSSVEEKTEKQQKEIDKNRFEIELLKMANEGKTYAFTTVENLAVKHDVPDAALPYARLDKIGGYTKKCDNLFESAEGCTINEQGQIVMPGYGFHPFSRTIEAGKVVSCSIRYISGTKPTDEYASLELSSGGFSLSFRAGSTTDYMVQENITVEDGYVLYVSEGWEGCVFEIMINEGATVLPWEAYFEGLKSAKVTAVKSYGADGTLLDAYTVPSAVQALDGYGIGISTTSNNGIDFANKNYTNRNGITTVSPSLTWGRTSSGSPLYWADHGITGVASYAEIYCNTYKGTPRGAYDGDAGDKTISLSKTKWYIRDSTLASQNDLKTVLTENPTFAVYNYDTPTTTDISAYITDTVYIKVEAGGYIVCENDDGIEALLTMTYQVKL